MIRAWRAEDETVVCEMLKDFLHAGIARGGDLLPTERNIKFLWGIGIEAAGRGEPCLVFVNGKDPCAFVLWHYVNGVDSRWRTCYALGSYTSPDVRSRLIARDLRFAARDICVRDGIERVIGPVHLTNARGLGEFIVQGAWPTAVQMERFL